MTTAGEQPKSWLPRLTAAQLIRIDWVGGLAAGAAMLALSPWLAGRYAVPAAQLRGLGIVNLVYGTASFTLAARSHGGDVPWLRAMASANLLWAACCGMLLWIWLGRASGWGLVHVTVEGLFVGALGGLEWRAARRYGG